MRLQRGFTLIELMVMLAIVGIIVAATVPGFIKFRSSMLRNQAKSNLVTDIRYARQLAVTRHRSVVVAFGNGSATTNITSYTMHTDLDADRFKDSGEPVITRTLPKGALLTDVALTPTDSLIFDMSGSLWPGISTGGVIGFRGPQGNVDTLRISAIGMVYNP